jgi:hypothetical protein
MIVRGYEHPIELFAPIVPREAEGSGSEVAESLAGDGHDRSRLGSRVRAGDGLGRRPASGLGRPASGERGRGSLP